MAAYTVTTAKIPAISSARTTGEPFEVSVHDEHDRSIVELDAMSRDHARMIAGALVMLLPKLDPGRTVVLDASLNGASLRRTPAHAA